MTFARRNQDRLDERLYEALAFKAPYVIDRLVKDRVADTAASAEELFTEAKKYFVLCDVTRDMAFDMYSTMVDAAWHAFILCTAEYREYGRRYFGKYLDHVPKADDPGAERTPRHSHCKAATFDDFRQRYEALYDEPLPDVWYERHSIVPPRRMINDKAGRLMLVRRDRTITLTDHTGAVLISVNDLAYPALNFVTQTSDFYVRELPGTLTDDEKVGLAQALAKSGVLRVAP